MASWPGGGDLPLDATTTTTIQEPFLVLHEGTYFHGGKRRLSHSDHGHVSGHAHSHAHSHAHGPYLAHNALLKRPRLDSWSPARHHHHYDDGHDHDHDHDYEHDHEHDHEHTNSAPLPFVIIREGSPATDSCAMERTESGLSISSDTTRHSCEDEDDGLLLSDRGAARLVREHVAGFRRRSPDSQHGRILKALINPKSRGADFQLDDNALHSIFWAANKLFFANRLSHRVAWDWSHRASSQYESHIVGTTALRRSALLGGYETLIVLSSPILKDTQYNRRLLISTFLHEMIHSFLFVTCGLKARDCGGHTKGFHLIAEIIDDWVGPDVLHLSDMEADLERFRDDSLLSAPPPGDDAFTRGRSEWRDQPRLDHDNYRAEPRSRRRLDADEWQWHEQEDFRARSLHGAGSSPYVY